MGQARRPTDYPEVLSEDDTIDHALRGGSLSRFGDGELRVCLGGNCASQTRSIVLAAELRGVLAGHEGEGQVPSANLLVCVPNPDPRSPRAVNWRSYANPKYRRMMTRPVYGSAFVTRPDSAPWIDRPDYWAKARRLWEGRDVVLVTGEPEGSSKMRCVADGAASLTRVPCPRVDAYAEADRIEAETAGAMRPGGVALLCLGATATALSARLAAAGLQALDLGHIGMFMGRDGR